LVHRHGAHRSLFQAKDPARAAGAAVTSSPAPARRGTPTRWVKFDRDGRRRLAQRWGGPIEEIRRRRGLVPPGEKHWHGAAATTAMTHIAIQEQLDGKAVDWMEQVTDEQYQARSRT